MQCLPTGLTVAHNVSMKEWCSVNEWSLEFVTVLFPPSSLPTVLPPYLFLMGKTVVTVDSSAADAKIWRFWYSYGYPLTCFPEGGGGNNSSDNKSSSTLWIRALPNTYLWTHEPSWSETLTEAFQISDVIKIYYFSGGKKQQKVSQNFTTFEGEKHKKVRKLSKNI